MTRAALLFTLALFAALIAIAGIAAGDDPGARRDYAPVSDVTASPPGASLAVLPGRQVTGRGAIVEVNIRYEDGYVQIVLADVVVATETPAPTFTPPPEPTLTPSVTPSKVPSATSTPTATKTPTPPATVVFKTPTAEVTLLPTIPATSIPKVCELWPVQVMRVRSGPGITYAQTGTWGLNQARTFTEFANDERSYLWGKHELGWSALYYWPSFEWFAAGAPGAELCRDVKGWPWNLAPPEPVVKKPAAWLIHVVPGYNVMALNSTYPLLASKGIGFGIKTYSGAERCAETLMYGGICIFRIPLFGSDCPDMGPTVDNDPIQSATNWMAEYKRHTQNLWGYSSTGRFFLELTNECRFGDETDPKVVHWWRNWLNRAADIALAENFPPAVVPSFGPGYGDSQWMYEMWREGLNKFASRGGLIGWHSYTPNYPPAPVVGLCVCDEWLGCRHRRNYAALRAAGVNMGYALTEVARGWGGETVDEQDFVCWYKQVRFDEGLHSVSAWTGGFQNDPRWGPASLDNHYISLAQKVVALN